MWDGCCWNGVGVAVVVVGCMFFNKAPPHTLWFPCGARARYAGTGVCAVALCAGSLFRRPGVDVPVLHKVARVNKLKCVKVAR